MSLKLEINHAALITALERKIDLMNTKYQQEISRLENRIKELERSQNVTKQLFDFLNKHDNNPGH